MNPICLTVLYNTLPAEFRRFQHEWNAIGISLDSVDHTGTDKGYAQGINELLGKHHEEYDTFIIANPDISIHGLDRMQLLAAANWFDVWGFAMHQDGKTYYGGEVDAWRLSGGLITERPSERYAAVEFVSGSLMVVTKKVVDAVGPFTTDYHMYYEDVDYCLRARRAGFHVGIDRDVQYEHFEVSQLSSKKEKQLRQARRQFFNKYANSAQRAREILRLPKTIWEERRQA